MDRNQACVICTSDGPVKDDEGNFEDVNAILLRDVGISAHPTCLANALRWIGSKIREEKRYRDKMDILEKELFEDCGPPTVSIPNHGACCICGVTIKPSDSMTIRDDGRKEHYPSCDPRDHENRNIAADEKMSKALDGDVDAQRESIAKELGDTQE